MSYEQFILNIYARLFKELESDLKGLTAHELNYQPKPQSNSIGWLAWHTIRSQDRMPTFLVRSNSGLERNGMSNLIVNPTLKRVASVIHRRKWLLFVHRMFRPILITTKLCLKGRSNILPLGYHHKTFSEKLLAPPLEQQAPWRRV
jgi:hypothetical protein